MKDTKHKWKVEQNEDGDWCVFCGKSAINLDEKATAEAIAYLLNGYKATPDYL